MDNEIPLTKVRSTASSTGARRAHHGTATGLSAVNSHATTEKQGFFNGRRQAKEAKSRSDTLASKDTDVNLMGRVYNKIIGFSVVTRYLIYIIPVAVLLAIPLIVMKVTMNDRLTVGQKDNEDNGPKLFNLFIWIEVMWLTLWGGKLVAHLLPPVFMFFIGVVSAGTRKYGTVLRALEIPLSLFFWALACFVSFTGLFQHNYGDVNWVDTLIKILGALFVSAGVFLGEKAIIQLISITYHQRSFANRIKDSKRQVHLLGLMYDASRQLFPMYCPEFQDEDYIINDSIELMLGGGKKKKGHKKTGSVNAMQLIAKAGGNVGRFGDKVTSVFGHVASEITGKQVFNPNSAHSIVVEALEKTKTSEALARRIWMSFVVEDKEALFPEDIVEVLGDAHGDEAEECFEAIDADSNGDISLDEMIRQVVEVGKERKAISHSMNDIGQALAVLDRILLFVVLIIVIFVFLAFFQSSFVTTIATAGTAILSLSFVFAVTTQEFLGSCIFLFVKHPYDVGDRVEISSEQMTVEKISLLYTVFNRIDKLQTVQVPNIVLNNLWVENITRSKAMKELVEVNVSYDTSFEDIELLRQEMEGFVRGSDNSRDFMPDVIINVGSVGDLDKLTLRIAIMYKSNWHNESIRAQRRSKFMCALALAMKKVPVNGPGGGGDALGGPANPSYSVSVSDSDAAAARTKADEDRQAARLANAAPPLRHPSTSSRKMEETDAVRAMHSNPVIVTEEWGYNREDSNSTLHESGDNHMERLRSHEQVDLHPSASQRSGGGGGLRRAGDGLPARQSSEGRRSGQYDEEAELGGPNPFQGFSTVQVPAASATHLSSTSGTIRQTGSRTRGASISRPDVQHH